MLRRILQSIPSDTKLHRASNYTGCPVFALLLITTSLYLGWVMDFITSPPSVLSCAICKCYLVSMISLCDLCLYFDPPVRGRLQCAKGTPPRSYRVFHHLHHLCHVTYQALLSASMHTILSLFGGRLTFSQIPSTFSYLVSKLVSQLVLAFSVLGNHPK